MAIYQNPKAGDLVNIQALGLQVTKARVVNVTSTGLTLESSGVVFAMSMNTDAVISLVGQLVVGYLIYYKGVSSIMLYNTAEEAHENAKACEYDDSYRVVKMEGTWVQ